MRRFQTPAMLSIRLLLVASFMLAIGCGPPDEDRVPFDNTNSAVSNNAVSNNAVANNGTTSNTSTNGATNTGPNNFPITYEPRAWRIGQSVLQRSIIAEQYGDRGPVLLVIAAIHGNERPAVTFAERWRVMLQGGLAQRAGVRVVFVPWANPDGIAASTRENANDVDLNRNFPAENFEPGGPGGDTPLSEPESQALRMVIDAVEPAAVISVHCCVPTFDYDGPGEELAFSMAAAMNVNFRYPVVRLGSRAGSMGSYVGIELGLPIITLEFQNDSIDTEQQLQNVERAMSAAATWVAEKGQPADIVVAEALTEALSPEFQSFVYGQSAGGLPLRGDDFLAGDQRVLILAGVNDNERRALNAAEHVRRVMLSEVADDGIPLSFLTAPNPDGIRDARTGNNAGANIATLEASPEVDALLDFVDARPPTLSIVLEADDQFDSVTAWGIELGEVGAYAPLDWAVVPSEERESPLVTKLLTHGPVIRVGINTTYAEGVNTPTTASPVVVSDFVRSVVGRFSP